MKHYQREILLAASPAAVYPALATEQGLRDWWTQTCDVATTVGGQSSFHFGEHYKVMRIETLVPDREVRWFCVEALVNVDAFKRKDEWVGTDIVFKLTPQVGGNTLLDFEHIGLTPALECFGVCERGWNQYMASLQNLVETGRGAPHRAEASCQSA